MGYVEAYLMPGEKLIHTARLQPGIFISPVLNLFFSLVVLVLAVLSTAISPIALLVLGLIGVIGLLASVYDFFEKLILYFTCEFGVTDRRVIAKTGFLGRRSIEIVLHQVEGITVEQGLFGRIGNYGHVAIIGTGGTREILKNIGAPFEFRKAVLAQLQAIREAKEGGR